MEWNSELDPDFKKRLEVFSLNESSTPQAVPSVDPKYLQWLEKHLKIHPPIEIRWQIPELSEALSASKVDNDHIGLLPVDWCFKSNLICLHPFLHHRNAPQFVIKFLIFYAISDGNSTQKERLNRVTSLVKEKHEEKVNHWLVKYGFMKCYLNEK